MAYHGLGQAPPQCLDPADKARVFDCYQRFEACKVLPADLARKYNMSPGQAASLPECPPQVTFFGFRYQPTVAEVHHAMVAEEEPEETPVVLPPEDDEPNYMLIGGLLFLVVAVGGGVTYYALRKRKR